jgi:hypothetical protein
MRGPHRPCGRVDHGAVKIPISNFSHTLSGQTNVFMFMPGLEIYLVLFDITRIHAEDISRIYLVGLSKAKPKIPRFIKSPIQHFSPHSNLQRFRAEYFTLKSATELPIEILVSQGEIIDRVYQPHEAAEYCMARHI